jgi:hypothetical protein
LCLNSGSPFNITISKGNTTSNAVVTIHNLTVDPNGGIDTIPYKCAEIAGIKKCSSQKGNVDDGIRLYKDWAKGKVCDGAILVIYKDHVTCQTPH